MRQRRSRFVPALLLAAAISVVGLAPGVAGAQEDAALTVGRLRLTPCADLEGAWCGQLQVPYDRADPAAGTIRINLEWYPAEQSPAGTIVAMEGGPVDLYGDSYGSYFGQTFAARHPELLRSLTLDATWPVLGTDPFYVSTIETARSAFDLTCRRSVACALAAPGSSMARIGALAERLRRAPIVGQTREPGSAPSTWRVDVGVLVALGNNAR